MKSCQQFEEVRFMKEIKGGGMKVVTNISFK